MVLAVEQVKFPPAAAVVPAAVLILVTEIF
jgi:hypothetical protein